jgi:VanZ family protein
LLLQNWADSPQYPYKRFIILDITGAGLYDEADVGKGLYCMQDKKVTFSCRIFLAAALITISYIAFSSSDMPEIATISDKLNHFLAFLALSVLVDFSWPDTSFSGRKMLWLLGYGLGIEVVQYFLAYRSFSLFDLAADAAGMLLYRMTIPFLKTLNPWKTRMEISR